MVIELGTFSFWVNYWCQFHLPIEANDKSDDDAHKFGAKDEIQFHQQNYAQLYQFTQVKGDMYLTSTLNSTYVVRLKDQCKYIAAKYAHKMMMKLTPFVFSILIIIYVLSS